MLTILTNPMHVVASDSKQSKAATVATPSNSEIHLQIGEAYEQTGQIDKAEAEYVVAASGGTLQTQTKALANLKRILQFNTDRNLQIAATYEKSEQWSQAETYYVKAAESAQNQLDRQTALEGIERSRKKSVATLDSVLKQTAWLPETGTLLLRILGTVILLFAAVRFYIALRAISRSTKIWQFDGDEGLSKLIQSAFPGVRAKAFSVLRFNAIKLPQTVSNVFPFVPIHLTDYLPEEAVEIGDLKIPSLASLLRFLVRPRLEIEGGILSWDSQSFVYAHVWRNRWFSSELRTIVTANVPKLDLKGAALELFIYDVYLKTWQALGSDERY
jgi:tetratricopeptide (TPR) repeat protein